MGGTFGAFILRDGLIFTTCPLQPRHILHRKDPSVLFLVPVVGWDANPSQVPFLSVPFPPPSPRLQYFLRLLELGRENFFPRRRNKDADQGPVVQRTDNAIHQNYYPVDSAVCFAGTFSLDSDLSDG